MTINIEDNMRIERGGYIKKAQLVCDNAAQIWARYDHNDYFVAFDEEGLSEDSDHEGWYFDQTACKQAAAFFKHLAKTLENN
jgi:hypothetical protein